MRITLISVGPRRSRSKQASEDLLADEYLLRANRYAKTEGRWVESEALFWTAVGQVSGRMASRVFLMDAAGKMHSSVEFADMLRAVRDRGSQHVFFGIGGADGWSEEAKARANLLSIGRWTFPHGLARIIVAEQIYRALTILAAHPYHSGH